MSNSPKSSLYQFVASGPQRVGVEATFSMPQFRDATDVFVTKIVWFKNTNFSEHEFLVFYAENKTHSFAGRVERTVNWRRVGRRPMEIVVLDDYTPVDNLEVPKGRKILGEDAEFPEHWGEADVEAIDTEARQKEAQASSPGEVERMINDMKPIPNGVRRGLSSFSSSSSSMSSLRNSMSSDVMEISLERDHIDPERQGSCKTYELLLMPRTFGLFQLAVLAYVIHQYYPRYRLHEYQCYWYAKTIYRVIRDQAQERENPGEYSKKCGTFGGAPIPQGNISNKASTKIYSGMYRKVWEVEERKLQAAQKSRMQMEADAKRANVAEGKASRAEERANAEAVARSRAEDKATRAEDRANAEAAARKAAEEKLASLQKQINDMETSRRL